MMIMKTEDEDDVDGSEMPKPLKASKGKSDFKYEVQYNKDWTCVCGANGSGKTTLMRYLLKSVPKDKLYVLSGGFEDDWALSANKKNIIKPQSYDTDWFNRWLLEFAQETSNCTLVLDDADNFQLKDNVYLQTIYINSRRTNLGGFLSVRRLSSIPIAIYNGSKYCIFARQNSDRNIWYIAEMCGMDIAKKLKTLKQYDFLVYKPSTGEYWIIRAPETFV
jgi:energy-coupling factor transporter ATP-binding protein EcfA2